MLLYRGRNSGSERIQVFRILVYNKKRAWVSHKKMENKVRKLINAVWGVRWPNWAKRRS